MPEREREERISERMGYEREREEIMPERMWYEEWSSDLRSSKTSIINSLLFKSIFLFFILLVCHSFF